MNASRAIPSPLNPALRTSSHFSGLSDSNYLLEFVFSFLYADYRGAATRRLNVSRSCMSDSGEAILHRDVRLLGGMSVRVCVCVVGGGGVVAGGVRWWVGDDLSRVQEYCARNSLTRSLNEHLGH